MVCPTGEEEHGLDVDLNAHLCLLVSTEAREGRVFSLFSASWLFYFQAQPKTYKYRDGWLKQALGKEK